METLRQLKLGVTEVLSNVMRHACGDCQEKPIVIKAEAYPNQARFRIYHWGKEFESPLEPPSLKLSSEGGMGLYLISQLFSEVTHSRDQYARNCVRLQKNIN